jgi:hypothetical protein
MPESKRKLDLICDLFVNNGQMASWVRLSDLCAESDRRQLNLDHTLITQYVRRYCINDPSNHALQVKNFVNAPRFVTADPRQRDANRRYRLLSIAERAAFQASRRADWHTRPYNELEARLRPPSAPASPASRKQAEQLPQRLAQRLTQRLAQRLAQPPAQAPAQPRVQTAKNAQPKTRTQRTTPARSAAQNPTQAARHSEAKVTRTSKQPATRKNQLLAIVDVSNVTREELDEHGHAKLASLKNLFDKLDASGVKTIAIADASLQGQIDDETAFRDYCRRGLIKQSPSRTEADGWILELASEIEAYIISRDTFRERIEKFPALRLRLVSFMVFDGSVMLDPEHPFTQAIRESRKKR